MRKPIVGTGWKMNLTAQETVRYAEVLRQSFSDISLEQMDVFVLPPYTSLHAASQAFAGSGIAIGGQNMHWEAAGSYTGEISAAMLTEAGCRYVALAHSERLAHCGETYEQVNAKIKRALAQGLTPILCLGERAAEKSQADAVVQQQLATALLDIPEEDIQKIILAYEPRWAISGRDAASPDEIAARHGKLREHLQNEYGKRAAAATRLIYGGSVNPTNGEPIISLDEVDGLFIGRAAWAPEGFLQMIKIVQKVMLTKHSSLTRGTP